MNIEEEMNAALKCPKKECNSKFIRGLMIK